LKIEDKMTAIRKEGKINKDTTLIDINMFGIPGVTAMYLIESGIKCIIDGGTHTEARKILRQLKELDAFPPDMIIITHSHWDHCQAVPFLSQRAKKLGKEIEVYASAKAIPNLKDQSFNDVYEVGPFNNFEIDVKPLKEGDIIDLEGITLRIFDVPGHMNDHIAILDEKNKNLFIGDAIGIKVADNVFAPPFMPPYWDKAAYLSTIEKLKKIDYESLSLAHFGCIFGDEAKSILDESVMIYEKWWGLYEENVDRIEDIPYFIEKVLPKAVSKTDLEPFGDRLVEGVTYWLSCGFKDYTGL